MVLQVTEIFWRLRRVFNRKGAENAETMEDGLRRTGRLRRWGHGFRRIERMNTD